MTPQLNGMHGSDTLKNDIFQAGPKSLELQMRIETMLAQFSPERKNSPRVQEALARIEEMEQKIIDVAGETRRDLVGLYRETVTKTHLAQYEGQVALLEAQNRARIAYLLGASNDEHFSQAA